MQCQAMKKVKPHFMNKFLFLIFNFKEVQKIFLKDINKRFIERHYYETVGQRISLDFISSYLYSGGEPQFTNQFIFNQVVVAILIINGALLSVRLNNALISLIKKDRMQRYCASLCCAKHELYL